MVKKFNISKGNFIIISILLIILGALIYGGNNDWFNINVLIDNNIESPSGGDLEKDIQNPPTNSDCTLDLSENDICLGDTITGVLKDGKNTHCYIFGDDGTGYEAVYEGNTNSNGLWVEDQTINALGDFYFRGLCDKNYNGEYDTEIDCITNQERLTVTDCSTPSPSENGISVGGSEGNGVVIDGSEGIYDHIDLGDLPPTGEGNCKLQALINTDWDYSTLSKEQQLCVGIQGQEGVHFTFSDSEGQVWERIDTKPTALGSATKCGLVWDGKTDFLFTAETTIGFSECEIEINYDVDVVTCQCGY